ncbi:MAG: tetratricopeptide repeat protein [Chloroflexi bacterium]|nr:tetratricopeptide repeat protein [Chloroflexota bacterium]
MTSTKPTIPTKKITLLFIAVLSLFALTACGNSAEKLNNSGNEAYTEQAYEEALAAYEQAQFENPQLAEPYYNAASTLYRQGDYAAALESLEKALILADASTEIASALTQSGYYNLGNNFYNGQELDSAIDAYTQALIQDPDDLDAKYNLELALQQQQQEQEQQEQQNEEQQEDQEQNQDQEQQEQDQDGESEQDQENEDQQEQKENGGDQNEQENENQSENEDTSQQNEDQQDQQEGDNEDQQPQDQQNQEQQQQGKGQPQDGAPQQGEPQPNYAPAPGERLSEEQARQLLAAIAQDGETLQERLGMMLIVPNRPPVQDW